MYELQKQKIKRKDLIYPELSYQLVGLLFEVHNNIGHGLKEKHYQKAVASELTNAEIKFEEQVSVPLNYKDTNVGVYILDFLVEGKVVLEIKKDNIFRRINIDQLSSYLKSTGLKLGIIANFGESGLQFKRIVNINDS